MAGKAGARVARVPRRPAAATATAAPGAAHPPDTKQTKQTRMKTKPKTDGQEGEEEGVGGETAKEADEEEVADYGAVAAEHAARVRARQAQAASATLFVRGLPYTATTADVEALCSQVGPVKWCFVVADKRAPPLPQRPRERHIGANRLVHRHTLAYRPRHTHSHTHPYCLGMLTHAHTGTQAQTDIRIETQHERMPLCVLTCGGVLLRSQRRPARTAALALSNCAWGPPWRARPYTHASRHTHTHTHTHTHSHADARTRCKVATRRHTYRHTHTG
jgi:hypothetical protein